jgi:hypothetical protein
MPEPKTVLGQWQEKPVREANGIRYQRWVVKTHLIRPGDRLDKSLAPYLSGRLKPDDIVVLGEKIVAIAQGRAVLLKSVRPRPLARFLARHVRSLGYGLGLRRPETMEMAFREAGTLRVILAAAAGALDRLVGRSGDFYRIAGRKVASIDGPGPTTIAPYNQYIVLAPERPQAVARELSRRWRVHVAIVDVNDIGAEVLALSPGPSATVVAELLRDNPMGQGSQGTPVAVLRAVSEEVLATPWPRGQIRRHGGAFVHAGGGDGGWESF